MNLTEELLSALSIYGLSVLFGVTIVGSIGIPLPISLLLVASGSFIEQGDMKLWPVVALASSGAILGDQIGYLIGRWGGRHLAFRISSRFKGGEASLRKAEAATRKWEGIGVFLTRWLFTPLGPWLNLTSGFTAYPWHRFIIWDVLGEVLWVVLYVSLGRVFSDRVQAMSDVLGNLTWVAIGAAAAILLGWKLFSGMRASRAGSKTEEAGDRSATGELSSTD
jgi:membrane protein DedA with SNARE-associated domain